MNTYLTDENLVPEFMKLRTVLFAKIFAGPNYPPNTLLIVNRLVKSEFLIEVQAVAAKTS
jgi:enamine deaminase RidA (YjgF/YER057c/UK114 family)